MADLFSDGFPAFIVADKLAKQYFGRVREWFPEWNLTLVDTEQNRPRVYASLVAPVAWCEPPGGRTPWREPEALLDYIRSSPGMDLGVYNRMWLAEKSSTLIRRSSAPAERALYREAVLLAAEKGRQAEPSVRFTFWLYWVTVTRVGYMRSAGKGQEWDALEAESVYDDFLAAVRVDAAWMSVALSGSRELAVRGRTALGRRDGQDRPGDDEAGTAAASRETARS